MHKTRPAGLKRTLISAKQLQCFSLCYTSVLFSVLSTYSNQISSSNRQSVCFLLNYYICVVTQYSGQCPIKNKVSKHTTNQNSVPNKYIKQKAMTRPSLSWLIWYTVELAQISNFLCLSLFYCFHPSWSSSIHVAIWFLLLHFFLLSVKRLDWNLQVLGPISIAFHQIGQEIQWCTMKK